MSFYTLAAYNDYTESQSAWGARNQALHIGTFNAVATTNLVSATPGTTAVTSDYLLLPLCQILDIGVINTVATTAVTTRAQLSLYTIAPGASAAVAYATGVEILGPDANTPINTITWYSLAQTPAAPAAAGWPTAPFVSLQGGKYYPQFVTGTQLQLLVDTAGVGGTQTARFVYRYRERDPGQPAAAAISTAAITYPNP